MLLVAVGLLSECQARPAATPSISPEPFVVGLNLPRGLTFDEADNLIVVEAGTRAIDADDASPTYTNHSSRVLLVTPNRQITIVANGLPFAYLPALGTGVGATDVAVMAGARYVLTGEGPDPLSRSVLRIAPGDLPTPIANISNFAAKGVSSDLMNSGVIRANPYALVAAPDGSALYMTDGASGRVLRITLDGTIHTFAELPDSPPLAGLGFGPDGRLYFTAFSPLPHVPGSGAVWVADASGTVARVVAGLTMPIAVGFDASGAMLVLEFGDGRQSQRLYVAGVGRLLRIASNGRRTTLLDHLNYPTAMAFSHAGDLYIAVGGAFTEAGQGSVVKVSCLALDVCPNKPNP